MVFNILIYQIVSFFFNLNIDVNLIGRDGETPLHTAARTTIQNKSIDIVC